MNYVLNQDTLNYIMRVKRVLIEELAFNFTMRRFDMYALNTLWHIDQYLNKEKLISPKDLILNTESLPLDELMKFIFEFENDIYVYEKEPKINSNFDFRKGKF